jgi:hypothetical protein
MVLSLRFHVVQYVDDPFIAEGRNVAILAYHGGRGHYRALGVDGDKLTPSHFKSLSSKARDSVWAYREWVEWFRFLANVRKIEQFEEAVARLEANNSGMVVACEGVIEMTNGFGDTSVEKNLEQKNSSMMVVREGALEFPNRYTDISDAMNYLFKRLVRVPKISPALAFEDRLEAVLNQSEIAYAGNFWGEPVEVEMVSEGEQEIVTLEFSHLMAGDRPIGFNTLVLQGATQKSISRQVERIATTFRNAVRTGYLQPDRCVILCGRVEEKHREIFVQFSGIATVLDVFDESTPRKIRKLAWTHS